MTWEQSRIFILNEATQLGFNQGNWLRDVDLSEYNAWLDSIGHEDKYLWIFERVVEQAEVYIYNNQKPEFIKEVFIDLTMKCVFEVIKSDGSIVTVTNPDGLINWDEHKDCKDTDKIFFSSWLDSDCKTVLKFYDYGSKRHLI